MYTVLPAQRLARAQVLSGELWQTDVKIRKQVRAVSGSESWTLCESEVPSSLPSGLVAECTLYQHLLGAETDPLGGV